MRKIGYFTHLSSSEMIEKLIVRRNASESINRQSEELRLKLTLGYRTVIIIIANNGNSMSLERR